MSQKPFTRFEVELEFVQCLANPSYLHFLAQSKVLGDVRFTNYVTYLEYFRKPEYAKLLTYPVHSLAALTLLQQPQFRADIMNSGVAQEMINDAIIAMNPEASTHPLQASKINSQQNGNSPDQ